jgi:hypothetical protein
LIVELYYTEALWVFYLVAKHCGTFGSLSCFFQFGSKALAVKDVVAQYQANTAVAYKLFTNDERLR